MTDQRHLAPVEAGPAVVESCWLCGIRLPTERLVADGGTGCSDLRWYCRDLRGCTERWTAGLRRAAPRPRGEQLTPLRHLAAAPGSAAAEPAGS